jgi:myo-inositol-1(or 4)-monophosphatase
MTPMTEIDPGLRLAAAEAVAREAGSLARRFYEGRDSLVIEGKGAHDLVSKADREVETLIRGRLEALFPADGFVGEEHAHALVDPAVGGHWVIDPIDGTWCFLNGIGSWCVSLAYERGGVIETGVVYDPMAGELFSARRGGGARMNGVAIRTMAARTLEDGSISLGYSLRCPPDEMFPLFEKLLRSGGMYQRHGSGALGLAWTACGRLAGYLEPHMNSWDALAGLLLIEEAGGFTNDFLAKNGLLDGNRVIAGPKGLRGELERLTAHWS